MTNEEFLGSRYDADEKQFIIRIDSPGRRFERIYHRITPEEAAILCPMSWSELQNAEILRKKNPMELIVMGD